MSTTLLGPVDAALVRAHERMNDAPEIEETHRALVALAQAAFEALVAWEQHAFEAVAQAEPDTWRAQLDELRVQAALAAMEARELAGETEARAEALATRIVGEVEELTRLTATR
jgi:hypothetical protein